jgi:hypothetical protein
LLPLACCHSHVATYLALQVSSIDRFLRFHIQCCESFRQVKLPACSAATGRPILTQTIILDMSGLSPMRHFTLTVQKFLHTLSQIDSVRGTWHVRHGVCLIICMTQPCMTQPHTGAWRNFPPTFAATFTLVFDGVNHIDGSQIGNTADRLLANLALWLSMLPRGVYVCVCVLQNNFPEHLGCLFMINTPLLFRSFW